MGPAALPLAAARPLLARAWARSPASTLVLALAALGSSLLALAGALGTALVAGYTGWHALRALASGQSGRAASWAALALAAGAPFLVAYGGGRGLALSLRALAGWRPRPALRALAAPAGIALAAIALQGLLASGSYFAGDDWLHLVIAHDVAGGAGIVGAHGVNVAYLDRAVFIHYAPGLRVGYWALERFAPLSWSAALGSLLVLFGGSLVLLHVICVRLFGRRRSNLVVLLLFGTSIVLVTSFLWFADGLHKLPSTFLSLLAIERYLRHRETGSRWALAASVAAVSLGLLFYVKVVLVPLYLLLIRVLFLEPRPRRALRVIAAERWTWLAFVPAVAVYLWNYQLNYAAGAGRRPPLGLVGHYLWAAWFRGAAPALAGVYVGLDKRVLAVIVAVLAQALFAWLVWKSARRKHSAWRAWAFWAVAFAANAALVGVGRIGSLGFHRVGSDLRYDTEMAWLLPLALAFAFFPGELAGRDAAAGATAAAPPGGARRRRLTVLALAGYLTATLVTGWFTSHWWRTTQSNLAKGYVENVRHDTALLARGGGGARVIGYQAPGYMISALDAPWNSFGRFVGTIAPRLHTEVATAQPRVLGQDGLVRRARLYPVGRGAAALAGAGSLRVEAGSRTGGGCLRAGARPAAVSFVPQRAVGGQTLYAQLGYSVLRRGAEGTGRVTAAGDGAGSVPLGPARAREVVSLAQGARLTLPPRSLVCVRSVGVGWLGP